MLIPLRSRVIVKRDEPSKQTPGGLYLPETIKDKPMRGTVVRVGPGGYNAYGVQRSMIVQVGQTVAFAGRFAGQEIEDLDGHKYLCLDEDEIICVISDEIPEESILLEANPPQE